MPPWHADPRYGHFAQRSQPDARGAGDAPGLGRSGHPLGDPKELPPPRTFPEGWTIGKPDVVFEMPETYYVPAQGVVSYVYFRVPTEFKEDMWVQAAEAVPGDRSVVHHIIVYVNDPKARQRSRRRGRGRCISTGYAPGDCPSVFPEGTAKRIPAGSDLLFQVHYTPDRQGEDRPLQGRPGLRQDQADARGVHDRDRQRRSLDPRRADDIAVGSSMIDLPADARLLSLFPHMHLRGKDFKFTITKPDESPEVVLSVPAYDFGWQTYYVLAEPMDLPKGTRIDCLAHFDNSENNPYNPDPNKLVRWGEQTFEEMMIGYLDMDVPVGEPVLAKHLTSPTAQKATMATFQRCAGWSAASKGRPRTRVDVDQVE